jgi:mannose-6-phosphate isomerase-like protein (cupin superfamily)
MTSFVTRPVAANADVTAPDGSEVRLLAAGGKGSMAHFSLPPGAISKAVVHRTVEELWFITAGKGRMWRKAGEAEVITDLKPGLSLLIPAGTSFQFRCDSNEVLQAVGVTMPPWPGADEAMFVEGPWFP